MKHAFSLMISIVIKLLAYLVSTFVKLRNGGSSPKEIRLVFNDKRQLIECKVSDLDASTNQ